MGNSMAVPVMHGTISQYIPSSKAFNVRPIVGKSTVYWHCISDHARPSLIKACRQHTNSIDLAATCNVLPCLNSVYLQLHTACSLAFCLFVRICYVPYCVLY